MGELIVPAADGRVFPVTRDDVAAACAAVFLSDGHARRIYTLTGPASLSFQDLAEAASRAFGTPITYRCCDPADYLLRLRREAADPWPDAFATMLASIVEGRFAAATGDVQQLTRASPESLEAFLRRTLRPKPEGA